MCRRGVLDGESAATSYYRNRVIMAHRYKHFNLLAQEAGLDSQKYLE